MSDNFSSSADAEWTVAFIGNPNTGKSTVFSALAGVQTRIGNYPGVTVEKKIARVKWGTRRLQLVDLPGTYSLSPRSIDEMVSVDVLLGRQPDVGSVDLVVCVVDSSNLERNLYLFSQLRDMGLPTILALNMSDVAHARGVQIDLPALQQRLGVPVVRMEAHRRLGLWDLREAILHADQWREVPTDCEMFPQPFCRERQQLAEQLSVSGSEKVSSFIAERLLLDIGGFVESRFAAGNGELKQKLAAARDRLRAENCPIPVVEARVRYAWICEKLKGIVTQPDERPDTGSDRIDRLLTHRWFGLVFFCGLMFLMFQSIYRWAGPLMGVIEAGQLWAGSLVESLLAPGPLRSLLVDGLVAGVGSVLVFLPQIAFLFLFIAVLEDCGYMARAAFLMDRLMTRVGLSGKSFVPLMSSFACAVPGIMATRTIENRRDRMVTILVAPLMSCSARLPVYLLLIGAFIPSVGLMGGWLSLQGLVLLAMSSLGALVAIPVAWLLNRVLFPGDTPPFVMELPGYKWPSPQIVLGRVWDRCRAFVYRAGSLIFATTVVVWAAGFFPGDRTPLYRVQVELESLPPDDPRMDELMLEQQRLAGELMAGSCLGRAGHAVEPFVRPLGWDWKIGVGVIASFPAREVIIATLGTIYSLGGDVDEADRGLIDAMQAAKWPDGRPVYSVPVALSLMVFFALCAQCGATIMVIRRETNSWRWPVFTFAYMTILAYVGSFVTYQIGCWVLAT